MGRQRARFRISLKDQHTGVTLKVELIPAPNTTPFPSNPAALRYRIRTNNRLAQKIREATLTEVFDRLRRWLVAQARREAASREGSGWASTVNEGERAQQHADR